MNKSKVFLGGTCNGSDWRKRVMSELDESFISYFDPVVEDWTPECQENEEREKWQECGIHLYVITPKIKGVYSIAEAVESAMCHQCIFCILTTDGCVKFDEAQCRSLEATGRLIAKHGGMFVHGLDAAVAAIRMLTQNTTCG